MNDFGFALDLSKVELQPLRTNIVALGTNHNKKGDVLDANNRFLIKNGVPWFPIMGEFHFSRYSRNGWENAILKMKAGGIDIIASYLFWIHFEEETGVWNWQDNRDLRYFITLCAKHQIYVFLRIGPWAHGECRNGGHPDWLLANGTYYKTFGSHPFLRRLFHQIPKPPHVRSSDPVYLGYVKEFYQQIHTQLQGNYFKDGGPVIGVQIENERAFNNREGLEYMLSLKRIAREAGIDVPYYTSTGWQGCDYNQKELLPVWGAYPDWPWARGSNELEDIKKSFNFTPFLNDGDIGIDLLPKRAKITGSDELPFPYLTAEMGAGTQATHHRRPIYNMYDGAALALVKAGSGANLLGYYMFHGGSNPIGKLTTLQESKASHYPNDLPIISYDFYAPLGEWNQVRPSYRKLKMLHYFFQDFGHLLVGYPTVYPTKNPAGINDLQTLKWLVRTNGENGFIFINNYQRHSKMQEIKNVQFQFKLHGGSRIIIPEIPIIIAQNTIGIFPFNLKIDELTLIYATTQPFCILNDHQNNKTLVMIAFDGTNAEIVLDNRNIQNITGTGFMITPNEENYQIAIPQPCRANEIQITLTDNKIFHILVLNHEEALNAWKIKQQNQEFLLLCEGELMFTSELVKIQSTGKSTMDLWVYPIGSILNFSEGPSINTTTEGVFVKYIVEFAQKEISLEWHEDINLPYLLKPSAAPTRPTRFSPTRFYPLYDIVLTRVDGAHYWKVNLPDDILQGVSDVFLIIHYEGDTQAVYLNGKLIADDFFAGEPMTIGLNRFDLSSGSNELVLLITPLENLGTIYLESRIKKQFASKMLIPKIDKIEAIPQYEVEFTLSLE
jgi:hypothetical protein